MQSLRTASPIAQAKRALRRESLLALSVLLIALLYGGGQAVYITQFIKGPGRGETGNDADQPFRSLTVSWRDPDVIHMGSEGNGIFRSSDGGRTWVWLRKGLKYPLSEGSAKWYAEVYDMAVDPADESIVYTGLTNGPYPATKDSPGQWAGVYKSTDGGQLWQQRNKVCPSRASA